MTELQRQRRQPRARRGPGHRFFLNPYIDAAFTRCPRCDTPTRIRKFPLVIHIEPAQLFVLNKRCRFCVRCDLIVARQAEVEQLMAEAFHRRDPGIVGNRYLVLGTLRRETWRADRDKATELAEVMDNTDVFRGVLQTTLIPGGWQRDGDTRSPTRTRNEPRPGRHTHGQRKLVPRAAGTVSSLDGDAHPGFHAAGLERGHGGTIP